MTAIAGKGTQLQLEIATVLTPVAHVRELNGPDAEVETFKSSDLDTARGHRYLPTGYVEGGNVSWSQFMDPVASTFQALTDLILTPAVVNWAIQWPDQATTQWTFAGILTTATPSVTMDDGVMADGNCKLDGIPAYPTGP